jgi:phage baseplate assembly protein V
VGVDRFLNSLKAQASALDQAHGQPRFGLVTSVDPASYTARVSLQPEGVLTGWLPVLSAWVGAGWGMACPPSPGDQVLVLAQEGDAEHGVIIGRAFSDSVRPPMAAPGELWLMHSSGSFLRLRNDGSVEGQATRFVLTGEVDITGAVNVSGGLTMGGTLNVGSDVHVSGNVGATGDIEAHQS